MTQGFTGSILKIDLTENRSEAISFSESFYRKYMGGSAVGAYFLLKETGPDTQPLDPTIGSSSLPGWQPGQWYPG
jgi:aldehyde:ferredoxin oxidoreductase